MAEYFTKMPGAKLDFSINWDDGYLAVDEDLVSTACTWESSPVGLTLSAPTMAADVHRVWIEGGTHGVVYTLKSKIRTSAGRIDHRSLYVKVWEGK